MTAERVLCAAIHVDTGRAENRMSYAYPPRGLVFGGLRHADCMVIVRAWWDALDPAAAARVTAASNRGHRGVQGFLTTSGRFVDRMEAYKIANAQGQIVRALARNKIDGVLTSEDLY